MYLCNLTPVAADEMGLGKTLTFISLVMKDLPRERKWRDAGPATRGEGQLRTYVGGCDTSLGTSLASVCAVIVAWFKMSIYVHVRRCLKLSMYIHTIQWVHWLAARVMYMALYVCSSLGDLIWIKHAFHSLSLCRQSLSQPKTYIIW